MRIPSAIEEQLGESNLFDTVFLTVVIVVGLVVLYRAFVSKQDDSEQQ